MNYTIHYNEKERILEGKFVGSYSVESTKETSSKASAAIDSHKCPFILNNFREAEADISTFDLVKVPASYNTQEVPVESVRAYVYSSDEEIYRFFETLSRNNGHQVKIFNDYDEAKAWLLVRKSELKF